MRFYTNRNMGQLFEKCQKTYNYSKNDSAFSSNNSL